MPPLPVAVPPGPGASFVRLRVEPAVHFGLPQDPVLFSGSVRSNLDPFGRYGEARMRQALEAVQLAAVFEGAGGLDAPMAEAGENLSVGADDLLRGVRKCDG